MSDEPSPPENSLAETSVVAEGDLQASSELFLTALTHIAELEREKRDLAPNDERREPLAREIEEITLDLVARSRYQSRLVELQEQALAGPEVARRPSVVLEEWRAAERRLHEARADLERAVDAADRLREEHRRSFPGGGSERPG